MQGKEIGRLKNEHYDREGGIPPVNLSGVPGMMLRVIATLVSKERSLIAEENAAPEMDRKKQQLAARHRQLSAKKELAGGPSRPPAK